MLLLLTIGSFLVAFLLSRILNWLALIPWQRSAGKHWTERARVLYPAVKSARMNNWWIPVNLGLLSYAFSPERIFFPAAFPAFLGCLFAGFFLTREVFPFLKFKQWLHLVMAGIFLFFAWWFLLILAIFKMPENFGVITWTVAVGLFLLWLAFHFGLGFLLLRWLRLLQPASNQLNALVAEVSQKMNVPVRATWILSTYFGNAAAFPQTRQLIFTDKLLSTLTDEETKAICSHELGHLNEPLKVLIVRALTSFAFFPLIFARPFGSLGDNGTNVYFLLLSGCLIFWAFGIRVARRMEQRADKIAVENQTVAAVYTHALAKLYELAHTPAVMPKHSNKIHPDLYDRMMTAGVTPDFPKPAPPKGQSWTSYFMVFCLIAIVLLIVFVNAWQTIWDTITVQIK